MIEHRVPPPKRGSGVSDPVLVRLDKSALAFRVAMFNHTEGKWVLLLPYSGITHITEWWPLPGMDSGIPSKEDLPVV